MQIFDPEKIPPVVPVNKESVFVLVWLEGGERWISAYYHKPTNAWRDMVTGLAFRLRVVRWCYPPPNPVIKRWEKKEVEVHMGARSPISVGDTVRHELFPGVVGKVTKIDAESRMLWHTDSYGNMGWDDLESFELVEQAKSELLTVPPIPLTARNLKLTYEVEEETTP